MIEFRWVDLLTLIARERFDLLIHYDNWFQEKRGALRLEFRQILYLFQKLDDRYIHLTYDLLKPENYSLAAMIIAHEMGHYDDCQRNYQGDLKRYRQEYRDRALYVEKKAWLYAIKFLEEVGFTAWSQFVEQACLGYSSYVLGNGFPAIMEKEMLARFKKSLLFLIEDKEQRERVV